MRVLVIEDEKDIREFICDELKFAGMEVLGLENGLGVLTALEIFDPNVVLTDQMMPGKSGIEVIKDIRGSGKFASLPVMVITALGGEMDKVKAFEMGADDYVTKPYNPREVVARVRARLRSSDAYQPQVLKVGELEMDLGRREVQVNGRLVDLTPSEFSLLNVLLEQSGYVLTRSELVSKALGADFEGLERTLDSHIRNLRRKIEPDPKNPRYIQTIYGVGYRLEDKSW